MSLVLTTHPGPVACRHLTETQRRILLDLIAENPGLTCGRIAALFAARTGRKLSASSVQRAWTRGYLPTRRAAGKGVAR